jgi:uncharacterized Zn finger protein
MCKHVAAVLYGVGARLDRSPELFFVLRQVDQAELLAGANAAHVLAAAGVSAGGTAGKKRIAVGALASVFGIELEEEGPATKVVPRKKRAAKTAVKPAAKKTRTKKAPAGIKTKSVRSAQKPRR